MRKGEIACYKHFLFFQKVFYPVWHLFFILNALLNIVYNLDQSKLMSSGNGLINIESDKSSKFKLLLHKLTTGLPIAL